MNQKEEILKAIGLSEDECSVLCFEMAYEYLAEKADTWADEVANTKKFWLWWRSQWDIIDRIFFTVKTNAETLHRVLNVPYCLYLYKQMHMMEMRPVLIPSVEDSTEGDIQRHDALCH